MSIFKKYKEFRKKSKILPEIIFTDTTHNCYTLWSFKTANGHESITTSISQPLLTLTDQFGRFELTFEDQNHQS